MVLIMNSKIILSKELLLSTYENSGRSLNVAAKVLGVSAKTIQRRFKEYGLEYDLPPRYTCNEKAFDQLNEHSMYWLGFLAADGNVRKHNYSYVLKLELASKDEQHLLKFRDFMKSNAIVYKYINHNKGNNINFKKDTYYSSKLCITSKYITDKLAKFNIVPNKTKTYFIPEQLTGHPLLHHFIRGFIDGDGCYSFRYNNKSPEITGIRVSLVGNPLVVNQIFALVKDKCKIDTGYCRSRSLNNTQFEFEAKDDVIKIVNYLYDGATVYLDRKAKIALKASSYVNQCKVLDIQKAEQIRKEYKVVKSSRKLAKKYNVDPSTILSVINNKTYLK